MIHTVKDFGIVNKAEIDVFLELSCFFHDPADDGNLFSGSLAFSKTSLNIWKFTVHLLVKPGLENFERYFTSVWDECNRAVVWAFFGIAFLWDWNQKGPFSFLLSFPNFMDLHSRFLCNISLYRIELYFHHQSHPQLGVVFTLIPSLHSFWSHFSTFLQ